MFDLEAFLDRFTARSADILGDALVGVYLHGSAVLGCFNPEKSDIDLLLVVDRDLPDGLKRRFMDMVVDMDREATEKGIEMSVVREDVLRPFIYPTPFLLHFSNAHLAWYERDPADYIAKMRGTDPDLAAHCTILRARGRTLLGREIGEVFGEVAREDYLDSIRCDVENAGAEIMENAVYLTLNLLRVLAYKEEDLILSKKEGGEWGLSHVPERFHALIADALAAYRGGGVMHPDPDTAADYAAYMLGRING